MLEKVNDKLLISSGDWYILLDGIYLGNIKFLGYKLIERKLEWVKVPRIKIYILIKMIRGESFTKAANRIFTKEYLTDKDYRNINKE